MYNNGNKKEHYNQDHRWEFKAPKLGVFSKQQRKARMASFILIVVFFFTFVVFVVIIIKGD